MTAREIGGYLQLESYRGAPVHRGAVALDCGRNCLAYLAELRGIEAAWLPDWLCGSVRGVCEREGVTVRTYAIGEDMLPAYDFEVGAGEWLYLVDYYGQLGSEDVGEALRRSGGRLIVDETQGLYRSAWEGADTLWTCRKWLGVPDGAYLATWDGARIKRGLPRAESRGRMTQILGRTERSSSEFLGAHREADASFVSEPVSRMSVIAESLLAAVDHEAVKTRRRENWAVLHAELDGRNEVELRIPEVPFMYPLLVPDSEGMRQILARLGIFVPTLWPDVLSDTTSGRTARHFAKDILPLPLDQRYGADDMEYVARMVKECLR